ncbi:MAG TPA: hypothetical protein VGI95_17675 [Caulobacteraceae bacterium]|jgi:hypothetical protein
MSRMPFFYESAEARKRAGMKPFLLFALAVAVMVFCATLWVR